MGHFVASGEWNHPVLPLDSTIIPPYTSLPSLSSPPHTPVPVPVLLSAWPWGELLPPIRRCPHPQAHRQRTPTPRPAHGSRPGGSFYRTYPASPCWHDDKGRPKKWNYSAGRGCVEKKRKRRCRGGVAALQSRAAASTRSCICECVPTGKDTCRRERETRATDAVLLRRKKKSTPTPGVHQTLYPPFVRPWPAGGGVIIGRG